MHTMTISSGLYVLIVFLFLHSTPTEAAEILCVKTWGEDAAKVSSQGNAPPRDSCASIWISGEIVSGDYDRLVQALETKFSYAAEILLSSPGGEVREGILMGRLIRQHLLRVSAPSSDTCGEGVLKLAGDSGKMLCSGEDCVCASSCFLLWAGSGTFRDGNIIGIHRPAYDYARTVFNEALMVYRKETSMPQLLQIMTEVRDYLDDMGIPKNFSDIMTRTASARVYWLSREEAASMQVSSVENPDFKVCGSLPPPAQSSLPTGINYKGANDNEVHTLHASSAEADYTSCIDKVSLKIRADRKDVALKANKKCLQNCSQPAPPTEPTGKYNSRVRSEWKEGKQYSSGGENGAVF